MDSSHSLPFVSARFAQLVRSLTTNQKILGSIPEQVKG